MPPPPRSKRAGKQPSQSSVGQARLWVINNPRPHYLDARMRWDNRLRFQAKRYDLRWRWQRLGRLRRVLDVLGPALQEPPGHWTGARWLRVHRLHARLTAQADAIRTTLAPGR